MIDTKYMYHNCYTEEFFQFAQRNFFRMEKPGITIVENGIVLPLKASETGVPLLGYGGVLDARDNYVKESAQVGKGNTADRFAGKYKYDAQDVKFLNEEVIYIGALPLHWGHFLIDMVHRFWIFSEEKYSCYKVVYCANNAYFQGVLLEFIQMLGINPKQLYRVDKPTRFLKIYVPEQSYMACDYFTQEYRNTFCRLRNALPQLGLKPFDKIYLSRGHFKAASKKEIGERNIEENFSNNGFRVLYMEELSLVEQVFYISNCKTVAALSGTLCHNILFANADSTLIILNKTHLINTHQVIINQMVGCKVIYIDLYIEPFKNIPSSYGEGPFLLDSEKLQTYFKDNELKFTTEGILIRSCNFLKYLKLCILIRGRAFFTRLYVETYHKVSKHRCAIIPLRLIKRLADYLLKGRKDEKKSEPNI